MNDTVLIQRCLAGDTEAFSELVKKHQAAVYGLCRHKVGDPTEAHDLAQETFVTAYLDLDQLKDMEKFSHWLYQIASNRCYSWLRKQGGKRQIQAVPLEEVLEVEGHPVDAASAPQARMEHQELHDLVAEVISTLSEKNQLVVRLYYIDELSYQEISDFLDLPISTIKSRLNKARRQLKEEFIKMVASDAKSNPLPDNFTEKVVQEALAKAEAYRWEQKRCETIEQCDVALNTLAQLSDTPQHLRWKSEALQMKGDALAFPRGDKEAAPYYEQVLEIKKNLGDKRDYAGYLNRMGRYSEALTLFEEIGDPAGQAESHLWLGAQAFFKADDEAALSRFHRSAALYDQLDTNQDWKAVCHAAIRVIQEIKAISDEGSSLLRVAVCETLQRESDQIIHAGQPGFSVKSLYPSEEIMHVSLFHSIAQMKPILDMTWQVGKTWEGDVFSYTFNPLKARKTFESDSEIVQTSAGEFSNCWKFRVDARQEAIKEMDEQTKRMYKINKINCGSREFWFAPGIGLVKYHADQESGLKVTIELAAYHLEDREPADFPLAVGNWWEYRPVGLHEKYVFKDRFEALDQADDLFFISHYQYAYWTGSEEERQTLVKSG